MEVPKGRKEVQKMYQIKQIKQIKEMATSAKNEIAFVQSMILQSESYGQKFKDMMMQTQVCSNYMDVICILCDFMEKGETKK